MEDGGGTRARVGAARAHTRGESGEGGHERGRPAGGGRSTAVAPDRRPSPPTPDQAHGTPPGFPHIDPARRTTRRLLPTAPSTPTTAGSGHAARRGHNPGGKRAAAGGAAASRGPPPGHASPGRGPARDSASARAAPTGRRPGSPAGTEGWARTPDARWRPGRRGSPAGTTAVAAGGTAARPTAFRIRAPPTRTDRDRHGTGPRTPPHAQPRRPQDRVRREGSPPEGPRRPRPSARALLSPVLAGGAAPRPGTGPPSPTPPHVPHAPPPGGPGGARRGWGGRQRGPGTGRRRPPCLHLGGRRARQPSRPLPTRGRAHGQVRRGHRQNRPCEGNPQPRHPVGQETPRGAIDRQATLRQA